MFNAKTIIEPFKIKVTEALPFMSREDRRKALEAARYNLFNLPSSAVLIDLLTDSGTSAMSAQQWSAMMSGDEAYAGSKSFEDLKAVVSEIMGFKHIIPTHQGRAAERILFGVLRDRQKKWPAKIPNNSHFDTTRANAEAMGFEAFDFPCEEYFDFSSNYPFKGNMNLKKLEDFLSSTPRDQIPIGFSTITNNSCGGQPVSFANIKATAELYKKYGIPFYLDACRFAENMAFIRKYEFPEMSPREIARKVFELADGCTFSAKKDALVNIGGLLATNQDELVEDMTALLILTEGFPTYGGLAGRDLAAMAEGLKEVLEPDYLEYRLAVTRYLGEKLTAKNIPFLKPAGGHAIYLDAKGFLQHLEWNKYPGHALALALYLEGGVRGCEIGSVMFGKKPDGSERAHTSELVRLAIPRRVYTQSHMDYVFEVIDYVFQQRHQINGVEIVAEPQRLRHFSAAFAWK